MACRFVGLNPKDMNFAKPEKVLEAARPDVTPDVELETASDVTPDATPDVTPEKKTSRKPRAEVKHK
nr:MAG TPA: hypothetical protein [Caudoviricetes sp.]